MSSITFLSLSGIVGFAFLSAVSHDSFFVEKQLRDLSALWAAEEAVTRSLAVLNDSRLDEIDKGFSFRLRNDSVRCITVPDSGHDYRFIITACVLAPQGNRVDTLQRVRVTAGPSPAAYMSSLMWYTRKAGNSFFSSRDIIDGGEFGTIMSEERVNVISSPRFLANTIHIGREGTRQVQTHAKYGGNPFFSAEPGYITDGLQLSHLITTVKTKAEFKPLHPPGMIAEITFLGENLRLRYHTRPEANRSSRERSAIRYGKEQVFPVDKYSSIYFPTDVEVSGTLRGRITLGAAGDIIVTDDILYHGSDPVTGRPSATDASILGLIADGNILLDKPLEKAARDGGIIVNASMIAADSALATLNPHHGHMGTFTFWGSLIERVHGTLGYIKGMELGYTAKHWHYDDRQRYLVPPAFPPRITRRGTISFDALEWKRML
jgi:hypothetical protein